MSRLTLSAAVKLTTLAILAMVLGSEQAVAQASDTASLLYIGPGAGFAFLSSFLVLLAAFALAIGIMILWPIRFVFRLVFRRKPPTEVKTDRLVILGLDGLDPKRTKEFMDKGLMPNFSKLAGQGCFYPLGTSYPSMSPTAWSSFMTGVDSSRHNIFDFITRDPCTYLPILTSADIRQAEKLLPIGKYQIPLDKPKIRGLRKSQPFWKLLGQYRVFSSVLRVPITFPPEKFNGVLLSGMCVPDLRGTQGSFSFYTTRELKADEAIGGVRIQARRAPDGTVRSALIGPQNSLVKGGEEMRLPFVITPDKENGKATMELDGEVLELELETYTPWITLKFNAGMGMKVQGIARFYLVSLEPEVELYVTPIQIDPSKPALPISHPFIYSVYLAKRLGPFATLGLAEDTWSLNERVVDESAFLKQAYLIHEEREKMFFDALDHTRKGFVACVFDGTDRIQHMFYRYLDPTHPANEGKDTEKHKNAIQEIYQRADDLLGRTLEKLGPDSTIIVMSDHGFCNFRRGVNLNAWLRDNGYLFLKDDKKTSGDWFENVDWTRTKAFSMGLTGVFINRQGREAKGIVKEGDELQTLRRELAEKLRGLRDEKEGKVAIKNVFITEEMFDGPYAADAPDLLIGYDDGFRHSWDCATGQVSEETFSDNTKSWSGDHCVDPSIVPGVFLSNKKISTDTPNIVDIAPSALSLFGVNPPPYMKGKRLFDGSQVTAPKPSPAEEVKV